MANDQKKRDTSHRTFQSTPLSWFASIINKVMFEGLLESILNKVLGQYIQGLNKKDLSISVWSGDVQLSNVKLRADIFK